MHRVVMSFVVMSFVVLSSCCTVKYTETDYATIKGAREGIESVEEGLESGTMSNDKAVLELRTMKDDVESMEIKIKTYLDGEKGNKENK